MLKKSGFDVLEIKKIEYPWTTEFNRPPRWLHSPKPWDWMVHAIKKSNVDEVQRKKCRVLVLKLRSGLHNPLYTVRLKIGCGNSKIKNGT